MVLAVLIVGGCGAGSADGPQAPAFPLSRAQAPPVGALERASGPDESVSPCPTNDLNGPTAERTVQLHARSSSGRQFAALTGQRLPIGALVSVCVSGFRPDLPVDAEVTSASARPVRHRWPAGASTELDPWVMVAAGPLGAGTHRLTIRQDGIAPRTFTFVVDGTRSSAGLWTDGAYSASAGHPITIGSGDNASGKDVHFDFYVKGADDQYRYWSTVEATADEHGTALAVVPTRPRDARSYLVMQRGAPDAPTPIDLFGIATGRVEGEPVSKPKSLFQRHDAPPADVARQVAYFQEGGPGACDAPKTKDATLVLGREVPRGGFGGAASPDRFELGDRVRICAFNFTAGEPATMTVRRPDGSRRTQTFPAELVDQDIGTSLLIMPDAAIGEYRVTVRQGAEAASARFSVLVPTVPGYETTGTKDRKPLVVVVGLPPHQRFRLSLYREPTHVAYDPSIPARLVAEFATSVHVRADERGTASYRLRTAPGDPKACFVIKVSYGKHLLDDAHNTLSTVCVPGRMYPEPAL